MISFPNAKINLGLNIISKRPDGYHNVETCFYPVGWSDILEILPAQKLDFTTSGLRISGNSDDNLCLKAYQLLKKDFGLSNVYVHLHKIVPMGAGLGGGSSDAAWTLRMLNDIFNLSLSKEKLAEYASALGSDCAFFLYDSSKLGKGRGEELSDFEILSLKRKFIVVVKPNIHISTAEAYSSVIPNLPKKSLAEVLKAPLSEWKDSLKNDFEEPVFRKYPLISTIKDSLYNFGAEYASMSGSGSAVFGIYATEINLRSKFPDMAYWSGFLQ
jgi:4-diphosphocytidyl-2-C-methyl-D-erythritol kinase